MPKREDSAAKRPSWSRVVGLLDYDPVDGTFTWGWAERFADLGKKAGTLDRYGDTRIRIDGRSYLASHLAWLIRKGRWPKGQIRHLDGDRLNNAIGNLYEPITPCKRP